MKRAPRGLVIAGIAAILIGTVAVNTGLRLTGVVHEGYWMFAVLVAAGVAAILIGALIHLFRGPATLGRRALVAAACVALAALGVGWPATTVGPAWSVETSHGRREYVIHDPGVPRGGDGLRPAVLVFHGFLQTPRGMRNLTGIDRLADEEGFLVVYPKGTFRSWNDGDDTKPASKRDVDDGAFLTALVDSLPARHGVDPGRVYAIGFSNGGYLLVRHACELAGRVAALGIVGAGTYPVWDPECRPEAPLPAAFVIGGADPTIARLDERFDVSPGASADLWTEAYGCPEPTARAVPGNTGTAAVHHSTRRCPGGFVAHQIVVEGEGHTWPGGPQFLPPFLAGEATDAFDATTWLWEFFEEIGSGVPKGGPTPNGEVSRDER